MKAVLATEMAPPFSLVAHFFIAGVIFLLLSGVSLFGMFPEFSGYFISSSLAAFAHLYLLGFVMMVIFGAMYQLLPVVLEIPLFSKDFAYVQFYMYVIGLSLMITGFHDDTWHLLIPYGGFMTYLSVVIFCFNVFLTFYRLKQNTIISSYLLIGTVFLMASVTLGLILGFALGHGGVSIDLDVWVKAHVLGTLFGFVMMIVMGVSMVLIPMFSLAHGFSDAYIKAAFYCHTIGVSLGMMALLASLPAWVFYGALGMICASMTVYVIQMAVILKARVRKQNDYWIKNVFFSYVSLLGAMAWLVVALMQNESLYIFAAAMLFFFGFLLAFIVGHLYKILPFLIWYQKFSPLVGKQKVPLLHQMVHTGAADWQAFILCGASFALSIGAATQTSTIFQCGAAALMCSVGLVAFNVVYAFRYHEKEA
jgi:hypothetical protein